MMAGGSMNMSDMHGMCMSDEQLASAKAELKITDGQLPLWNGLVDAMKSCAQTMRQGMGMMQGAGMSQGAHTGSGMMMAGPLPQRLERHEQAMSAHLDAMHRVRMAISPLYATFSPDQMAKADQLLCAEMGHHDKGATKGHDSHSHPHQ